MFFSFFALTKSTWWNFSESEFPKILEHSFEKPLFHLCFSRYCPHCFGLSDGFINFNKTLGDRDDIFISKIDCAVERGCYLFKIHGTPSIKLVRGKRVRYWIDTGERGANGWTRFINENIGPNLREIFNESQLEDAKVEPKDGGTTFYLETPSENHSWVNEIRKLSKEFRIYNDTFVYKVNKKLKSVKLHAFRSKYCDTEYSGFKFGLRHFIDRNKFGVLHRYDIEEFERLVGFQKAALLIVPKDISDQQKQSLVELSKDHCHDGIEIGWANIQDQDADIIKYVKTSNEHLPLLFSINIHSSSKNKYKGRVSTATENGFLPKTISLKEAIKGSVELKFIFGFTVMTCLLALVYLLFYLVNGNMEITGIASKLA